MFRTDTALGRFLNDLAYADLSDTYMARKHSKPIEEVRETRIAVQLGQRIGKAINGKI